MTKSYQYHCCFSANKAIAEVRTKQGAEVATLQVQLRREQLKVQSLEKDLEQKVHECTQEISLTVVVQQILMDVVLNYLVLNIYIVFHCFF